MPATLDPLALMQRWKQHTQGRITARLLGESLRCRRVARVARAAFDGWSTGVGPKQRQEAQAMAAALAATATTLAAVAAAEPAGVVSLSHHSSAILSEQEGRNVTFTSSVAGEGAGAGAGTPPSSAVVCTVGFEQPQATPRFVRRDPERQTFAERGAETDLRVARRTVVAGWRGALTREIGLRQAKREWRLKQAARLEPT